MLKYIKKGERPTPTGGVGNSSLNKMKDYEHMDWRDCKPNMKVAKLAADEIARRLSSDAEHLVAVSNFYWDESDRQYIAFLPAKIVANGETLNIVEVQGHYFKVFSKFSTFSPAVIVTLEEIDYGHYHRYSHVLNELSEVCVDCPNDVYREAA